MNQQITNHSPAMGKLFRELFWPFQTLSWHPTEGRDGTTKLTFSLQMRRGGRPIAVRWLILSGCFLVAAGVASTVLLLLGCVSAVFALVVFLIDWQIQPPASDENTGETRKPSDDSHALHGDPNVAIEKEERSVADIHRLPKRRRAKQP